MQQINNQSQSAALADYIKKQGNNSSPKPQVAEAKTDEIKEEAVENKGKISFTGNKKKAAIIGGVAALAIAGIGITAMVIKNKVPIADIKEMEKAAKALAETAQETAANANKMADEAQELAVEANKLINEAQAIVDNVTALFRKGGLDDSGKQIAAIREVAENEKIMTETLESGVTRRSNFVGDVLSRVEEMLPDGKRNIIDLENGAISDYRKGYERLTEGGSKAAQEIHLEEGRLSRYITGNEFLADQTIISAKELNFKNGEISSYQKGYIFSTDNGTKIEEELNFENGEISRYKKGYELLPDFSSKTAEQVHFEQGKIIEYVKGDESLANNDAKVAHQLSFNNGKITEYLKTGEELDSGEQNIAEILTFSEDGNPESYYKNWRSNYTADKVCEFKDGRWVNTTKEYNRSGNQPEYDDYGDVDDFEF